VHPRERPLRRIFLRGACLHFRPADDGRLRAHSSSLALDRFAARSRL